MSPPRRHRLTLERESPLHRKTVDHPALGPLLLDCDTLHVPDADQMVVVYSAEPGTSEAEALALLGVVGTQALVDSSEG